MKLSLNVGAFFARKSFFAQYTLMNLLGTLNLNHARLLHKWEREILMRYKKNNSQNPILAELRSRECSDARRYAILAELKSQKDVSASASVEYASALAFCLNRERNWEMRLKQLKELRQLAKKRDAAPETALLYVQAVYHRLNAEMNAEEKLNCCETLFKFCKSARQPLEIQKLCTQGILNALSRSNHPAIYRRYRDQLFTLIQSKKLEKEIMESCVVGLEKYMRIESDFSFQKRLVSRLERLYESYSRNNCVLRVYATCLQLLISHLPNATQRATFLEKLKCLADEMMIENLLAKKKMENASEIADVEQVAQEIQHLYATALIAMIEMEPTVKGRLKYLDALEGLSQRPDPFFQGTYTQGMVEIIKWEQYPEYCLGWLERLKERVNALSATQETVVQYVGGMTWVLLLTKSMEDGMKLLEEITYWTHREAEMTLDLRCLYGCALLLSMRWINDSEQKKACVEELPNWKTVAPCRFGDLYRSVLQDYIANEWDDSFRNAVLARYR